MATVIAPEELYFGAPTTLTYGGVDCGATLDAPKFKIDVTKYEPDFQNARGPVMGTSIVTKVVASVTLTVNQITAAKLAWAMPGSSSSAYGGGTVITWDPGRVPSEAYQDLVLVGPGLDGRLLVLTLENAMSAESQELDFSDTAIAGLSLVLTAYYDPATPDHAPFSIRLTDEFGS